MLSRLLAQCLHLGPIGEPKVPLTVCRYRVTTKITNFWYDVRNSENVLLCLTFMPREEVVQIVGPMTPSLSHLWAKSPSDCAPKQGDHQTYKFLVQCKKFNKCALTSTPREEVVHNTCQFLVKCKVFRKRALIFMPWEEVVFGITLSISFFMSDCFMYALYFCHFLYKLSLGLRRSPTN